MVNKGLLKIIRTTEFIAAMLLAAIFITFLLQIFTRYAPKIAWLMPISNIEDWMKSLVPIGWTVNLISLLWVWLIFFGCAFFVRQKDHVSFDILFHALPAKFQKILTVTTALIIISTMIYSFGPTYDAIFVSRLMELKKIQTLYIPITEERIAIKWLFAPYILLMIMVIIQYSSSLLVAFNFISQPNIPEPLKSQDSLSHGDDK